MPRPYSAGTWELTAATALIECDGRTWHDKSLVEKNGPSRREAAGPQGKVRVDLGHWPSRRTRVLGQRRPTPLSSHIRAADLCELAHRSDENSAAIARGWMAVPAAGPPRRTASRAACPAA